MQLKWEFEGNKLSIVLQLEGSKYQGSKNLDPDIDFDFIKDALNAKKFQIINRTS